MATANAGRLAGISLTAIGAGLMAFLMPPVFSFRVESSVGIAAVILNGLVGLLVAHTVRPRRGPFDLEEPVQERPKLPPLPDRPFLGESLLRVTDHDALRARASDVYMHFDENLRLSTTADELDQVLLDILRIAFSHSNVLGSMSIPVGARTKSVFGLRRNMLPSASSLA